MNVRAVNGQNGGKLISDTALYNFQTDVDIKGFAEHIHCLTATKFHTLTGPGTIIGLANTTEGSAFEVPANTVITGRFTGMQLHDGDVIVYKESN